MPRLKKSLRPRKSYRRAAKKSLRRSRPKRSITYRKRSQLSGGYLFYPGNDEINEGVRKLQQDPDTAQLFANVPDNLGTALWDTFKRDNRGVSQKAVLEDFLARTVGPEVGRQNILDYVQPNSKKNVDKRASERTTKGLNLVCHLPKKVEEAFTSGYLGNVNLSKRQEQILGQVRNAVEPFCSSKYYKQSAEEYDALDEAEEKIY